VFLASRVDPASPPKREDHGAFWVAVATLTVAALLLRLLRIGENELQVDEAYSFYQATTSAWPRSLLNDNNPPLYYALLRGWVRLAGVTEGALRAPSALFGALFVPACAAAGRALFNGRIGLWCALAATVSPLHIYYSQEARGYALLVVAIVLAQALAWRSVDTGSAKLWLLGSLFAVLALYTNILAIIAFLPVALLPALHPRKETRRRVLRRLAATCAMCAAALLPWAVGSLLARTQTPMGAEWIRAVWEETPPLLAVPRTLETMAFGNSSPVLLKQLKGLDLPLPVRLAGLAGLCALGLAAAVPWGDRRLGVPDAGRRRAYLWLLLLAPLAVLWGVSFVKPVYVVGRYDLVALPAFVLLTGLALGKMQDLGRRTLPLGLAAALMAATTTGATLVQYYRSPATPDAKPTASAIDAGVSDGDVVVFTGLRGYPVLYYLARLGYACDSHNCVNRATGTTFRPRFYPREIEAEAATYNPARVLGSSGEAGRDLEEYLRARGSPGSSVWLVFCGSVSGQSLDVGEADWLLIEAIRERGYLPSPASLELCIFRFK
jgi:mannosyltransferase